LARKRANFVLHDTRNHFLYGNHKAMAGLMYIPDVPFTNEEYIVTSTQNIISRKCNIQKPSALEIPSGKCFISHGVTIRADLAPIQIQKYSFIEEDTVLQPCSTTGENARPIPLTIGSHCLIGKRCTIEAAVIGMGCTVGDDCHLSPRCILKDFVKVVKGAVVPSDMVCPPFSIIAGSPGRIVGSAPEGAATMIPICRVDRYKALRLVKPEPPTVASSKVTDTATTPAASTATATATPTATATATAASTAATTEADTEATTT
jgi:dynactin-5